MLRERNSWDFSLFHLHNKSHWKALPKPPLQQTPLTFEREAWEELSSGSPTNSAQLHYMLAGEVGDFTGSDDRAVVLAVFCWESKLPSVLTEEIPEL